MMLPSAEPIATIDPAAALREWDVVVVGGGPAGTVAAWQLAGSGHAVLIVERHPYPRDKVCGDGLIADALRMLRMVGAYDEVRRHGYTASAVRIYSPGRVAVGVPGEFVTIRRRDLDTILARAALARGAQLITGTVRQVTTEGDGVSIRVDGLPPIRGRFAVVATGADISLVAPAEASQVPSAVAARAYVRGRPQARIGELLVSFDRSIIPGYAWIFPLGGDTYNIGCGVFYAEGAKPKVNLREMLRSFVREFPPARALGIGPEVVAGLQGARLRCGLVGTARIRSGRVIAIGEVIGTTFPFTGEGIGKAMETGAIAARHLHRALVDGDLAHLDAIVHVIEDELRPRYRGYEVAQRWLSRAWLSDLLARRAARSPHLRTQIAAILNETADPRSVFSLRGLVPSLTG